MSEEEKNGVLSDEELGNVTGGWSVVPEEGYELLRTALDSGKCMSCGRSLVQEAQNMKYCPVCNTWYYKAEGKWYFEWNIWKNISKDVPTPPEIR